LFGILQAQGYVKAYAGITLPNAGSVGLHESVGFQPVAVFAGEGFKFGQWHDVGWWDLTLRPAIPDPPEPKRLSSIRESAEVAAALAEGERKLRHLSST
jgi:phosphinothricin acetyltransferase